MTAILKNLECLTSVSWSNSDEESFIPCKFHRATPTGKSVSKIITPEEADWWFMYQTLIGDTVDGYYGCKGIGDKTARKLLGVVGEKSLEEMWEAVKETFVKGGMTEKDVDRLLLHLRDFLCGCSWSEKVLNRILKLEEE